MRLPRNPSPAHASEVTDESEGDLTGRVRHAHGAAMEAPPQLAASSMQMSAQDTVTALRSGVSALRSLASVDAGASTPQPFARAGAAGQQQAGAARPGPNCPCGPTPRIGVFAPRGRLRGAA